MLRSRYFSCLSFLLVAAAITTTNAALCSDFATKTECEGKVVDT